MTVIKTKEYVFPNNTILHVTIGKDERGDNPRESDDFGKLILRPDFSHFRGTFDEVWDDMVPEGENLLEYMRNLIGEALGLKPQDVRIYLITKYKRDGIRLVAEEQRGYRGVNCGVIFAEAHEVKERFFFLKPEQEQAVFQRELTRLSCWLNEEAYYYTIARSYLHTDGSVFCRESVERRGEVLMPLEELESFLDDRVKWMLREVQGDE